MRYQMVKFSYFGRERYGLADTRAYSIPITNDIPVIDLILPKKYAVNKRLVEHTNEESKKAILEFLKKSFIRAKINSDKIDGIKRGKLICLNENFLYMVERKYRDKVWIEARGYSYDRTRSFEYGEKFRISLEEANALLSKTDLNTFRIV